MNKLSKTTATMKDTEQFPSVQVTYLEKIGDVAVANPYGLHSSPDQNSAALLIILNNDPSSRIIIPLSSLNRNKNLLEGEVELGNFKKKASIKFDENGDVLLGCEGTVYVDCPEILLGQNALEYIVKATKMKDWVKNEIASVFNSHTHPTPAFAKVADPTSVVPVSAPIQQMSNPSESDIASESHKVGE